MPIDALLAEAVPTPEFDAIACESAWAVSDPAAAGSAAAAKPTKVAVVINSNFARDLDIVPSLKRMVRLKEISFTVRNREPS